MRRQKILIIEDEPDILDIIQYNLSREGFRVVCSQDGESGLLLAKKEKPDLILLDVMLPNLDGIEVCRRLKQHPGTKYVPIIMVTARSDESDVVLGLGLGADDYIAKPFVPRILVARVKAVLRRNLSAPAEEGKRTIRVGSLLVDAEKYDVQLDGQPIPLTTTEFKLLYHLASQPGRVFTRDNLLQRIIEGSAVVVSRNVDVHVTSIRRKMGNHRGMIETVRGVGYRLREAANKSAL